MYVSSVLVIMFFILCNERVILAIHILTDELSLSLNNEAHLGLCCLLFLFYQSNSNLSDQNSTTSIIKPVGCTLLP